MMSLNFSGADRIYDLLRSVGAPDFKANMALLAEATAANLASAEALSAANTASVWTGRLAKWEADLERREKVVRLGNAKLEDTADAISRL